MTDVVVEYLVKRATTPALRLKQLLIVLAGAGVLAAAALLLPVLGILELPAVLAVIFGVWYFLRRQQVEFEYAVTNGEFDLDRIIARSSRKRLLTFHCRDVERLVPFQPGEKLPAGTITACSSLREDNLWLCTFKHSQKGSTTFLFNTSEALLAAMGKFVPGSVRREAFGARL